MFVLREDTLKIPWFIWSLLTESTWEFAKLSTTPLCRSKVCTIEGILVNSGNLKSILVNSRELILYWYFSLLLISVREPPFWALYQFLCITSDHQSPFFLHWSHCFWVIENSIQIIWRNPIDLGNGRMPFWTYSIYKITKVDLRGQILGLVCNNVIVPKQNLVHFYICLSLKLWCYCVKIRWKCIRNGNKKG